MAFLYTILVTLLTLHVEGTAFQLEFIKNNSMK